MNRLLFAALLVLSLLEPTIARAFSAEEPTPMTSEEIKIVVQKAARVCADTPPPTTTTAEAGNYRAAIKPVVDQGPRALPALKSFAAAKDLSPVERRFAQILADRIEHPEHFVRVAAYLIPLPRTGMEAFAPTPSGQRKDIQLRRISPDLVLPEVRKLWADYQAQLAALDEKYERLLQQAKPDDRLDVGPTLWSQLADERLKVRQAVKARLALPPSSGYPAFPRLDPQYLLAWEEAMLRPLPWAMRHWYTHCVFIINDPASLPALGAVLRQAAVTPPDRTDFSDPLGFSETIRQSTLQFLLVGMKHLGEGVMHGIVSFVIPEAVRELSEAILAAKDYKGPDPVAQEIGIALAMSKPWRDYLGKPEPGDQLKDARDRLRLAMREGDKLIEQTRKEVEKDKPPSTDAEKK